MVKEVMLTTIDNPFNPFKEFIPWFLYDVEKGYNTCGHLDRIMIVSDDMSEEEFHSEMERAIEEIIDNDFLNIYKKIYDTTLTTQ